MSCHSGRNYDAREYADTWTYVDKTLFGTSRSDKLRKAGRKTMRRKEPNTQPIIMYMEDFLQLQARANKPLDPVPEQKPRKKHPVKIERFAEKKPTVLDQYTKRVRQAQAGGGANARAYALKQDQLDEVKNLKTQLRAMEVNEGLNKQVRLKKEREDAEAQREREEEAKAKAAWEAQVKAEFEREKEQRKFYEAYSQELRSQREEVFKMKILDEERREQENKAVRLQLEAAERKEKQAKLAILEKEKQNAAALKEENIRAKRYRLEREERERLEDLAIVEYNQKKDAEQLKIQLEKQEADAAREKEIARLRELQEKSRDKQAEEDQRRALVYQEQRILKREAEDKRRAKERADMLKDVLAERQRQMDRRAAAREAEFEAELEEVARIKREFQQEGLREMKKEAAKKAEVQQHWQSVDALAQERAQDVADKKQEQLNWDKKFAMNKAVYDHEVSVAYDRMLSQHKNTGHTVPKHFRDGAAEARQARAQQRKKAQQTRPLW